jgi:hypothetical protein
LAGFVYFDRIGEKLCFWLCAKKSPICEDMGEGESIGFTMDMSRLKGLSVFQDAI